MTRAPLGLRVSLCAVMLALVSSPATHATDDVLQRTRAVYAELRSYADSGVVINEYGTSSTDRHTFTTAFVRVPRHFLLDFRKQLGDRFVIWANPDAFHTWWKATGGTSDYPNPDNAGAISLSGRNSVGVSGIIPPLLYSKAALGGDFANFVDVTTDGTEVVDGHRCHRLRGRVSDRYSASGKEVNVRSMSVWIDAESLLIRKVLEEWVPLPGQRSRVTTIYEPQANPTIDDSRFKFTPPSAR